MARNKTPTVTAPKQNLPPILNVPCVLQVNGNPFGGKDLGVATSIATSLLALRTPDKDSYLGLVIEFPLPDELESIGFGKCHRIDRNTRKPTPSNTRKLTLKFPREDIDITYRAASEEDTARYPAVKKLMTWVKVSLGNNAEISVKGFGMPYSNPGHPAEDWLRSPDSTTVIDGMCLQDIILQRHFSFLVLHPDGVLRKRWSVASLAPKFDYGYGADQSWDMDRYMKQLHDVKGHRFQTSWSFDTDLTHVTVLAQSLVQDFMWIQKTCLDMTTEMGSAYFVKNPASRHSERWYVIVRMDRQFWKDIEWSQACIHGTMKLVMHSGLDELPESWTDDLSERWAARICHDPEEVSALNQHPLTEKDFVIRNRVSFEWDLQLHDAKRQVDAVCDLLPSATPNRLFFRDQDPKGSELGVNKDKLRMSLHRDLLRGDGFWQTMMSPDWATDEMAGPMGDLDLGGQRKRLTLPMLPSVNLLKDDGRSGWADALFSEVSEADQCPLRNYLSNRPLGFDWLIIQGSNTDDTSVITAAVLALNATVGKVMASGPTPAAINKFASDLYAVSRSVARKYNIGRRQEASSRAVLIVRGFRLQDECNAFKRLLQHPHLGDDAAGYDEWGLKDDSDNLHEFQRSLAGSHKLARLLQRVSGKISWEDYVGGETVEDSEIMRMMTMLIENADIVGASPSLGRTEDHLRSWKVEQARGVAIDDAGRMSRGDLYSIWGNTLLPCILAGDMEFVPLEVKSYHNRDVDGNMRNRFGDDARKSALEFLVATGWPVYRVRG
ncbi:hypothetical protein FGADI_10168 [Fusarium gaditjirri]|uniref:Uncharacterized protein n=1 Tax=Fusarium gaditjirri TaxID=282569 RepID=A0A8H4SYC9_9HYPO|nr:hypothetical protein FGADI_10168 [Fusarium gaditjirri]